MAYPWWVGRVADWPRSLRNAWLNRPGRRVADGLCSRPPLWGSDRRLPHWAAGLLGREDGRVRGCPSVAALAGPSSTAGVAAPVAGCVGRGSGLCCGLADPGRARARASTGGCARLPTWPSADSPLMRIRWEDRTVGESAPSGRRGEGVEETGCKRKSNVVINHRCRGHKSFSDFDSWGRRSQLPLRGQAGAGRLLEGSRRAAAATTMAATC